MRQVRWTNLKEQIKTFLGGGIKKTMYSRPFSRGGGGGGREKIKIIELLRYCIFHVENDIANAHLDGLVVRY